MVFKLIKTFIKKYKYMKKQEKILQDELKDKKERWINIQLINRDFNKYQKTLRSTKDASKE